MILNRRQWLGYAGTAIGGMAAQQWMYGQGMPPQRGAAVKVRIDEDRALGIIPEDFVGLGYEIASVARPGLLSASDRVYTQLVRTLGAAGVIRVGGNTADYAAYAESGTAVSAPKATVVNRRSLEELGSFLEATGWKLIWGLDLGEVRQDEMLAEAQAVQAIAKDKLLAFEIGNEVDLFVHEGHRQKGYGFDQYLAEYRQYKAAIRAKLPDAPFAGPDSAGHPDWVRQFAAAEAHDLKLLTQHYYRGNQSPASSLAMLLNPDANLTGMLGEMQRIAQSSGVPYRICETNSFSGGGKPGVSGTFGAGLWVLDYLFTLASFGAAGVNLETGVNQLNFISSYSPIGDDEHGRYTAMPEYYGMLAFAQASKGRLAAVTAETGGLNVSAYAVTEAREVVLTVINKESERPAAFDVQCMRPIAKATALRLMAPTLESSTGVTLGGASVDARGRWTPRQPEAVAPHGAGVLLKVPARSAAVVTLTRTL